MRNKINDINQDLDYMLKLIGKYPYLSDSFHMVIERLNNQKRELEKIDSLNDLPGYKGEAFNLIDKDKDDLSIITAKLQAQQDWIDRNKE